MLLGELAMLTSKILSSLYVCMAIKHIIGASLSKPHSLVAHRAQAQCMMVGCTYVHGTFATVI
jgi:hypothetical protein